MRQAKTLYLLLMAALLLTLSACGDDDDKINTNSDLLQGGTWTFEKASVNVMGMTMNMTLDQIRQMYADELGTNNIMFIDEKLRFEEEYVVMVNTGERLAYKYYSNGSLWIEGMDEMAGEGISFNLRVTSLSSNKLVLRYDIKVSGMTISEDVYYTR